MTRTPQDQIAAAQRAVFESLIRWERATAALYAKYASRWPEADAFWRAMEREEHAHALLLATLEAQLDAGAVFWRLGEFSADRLHKQIEAVEAATTQADAVSLSERDALFASLQIEHGLAESGFYRVVACDNPVFKRVAETLTHALERHIGRVEARLRELDGKGG